MTPKIIDIPIFLLFCVLYSNAYSEPCIKHPWNNSPPSNFNQRDDVVRVVPVIEEYVSESVVLLEEKDILEIDGDKYESLTGYRSIKHNHKHFLVRALKDSSHATLVAYYRNNSLSIVSLSMGQPKATKNPVVVSLPDKPKNVYISCEGAW